MEHETTGRRRESDRLLGELRRQLRAELMHEFLLKDGGAGQASTRLPVTTLGLAATAATFDRLRGFTGPSATTLDEKDAFELIGMPQTVCKPFRLCIHPEDAADVEVFEVRLGAMSLLMSNMPIPAEAFPPLPAWMLEHEVPQISAVRDAPIENVHTHTALPGLQVSVRYRYRADAIPTVGKRLPLRPIRAWFLVYSAPSDAAE
jgi:hypothetical protein